MYENIPTASIIDHYRGECVFPEKCADELRKRAESGDEDAAAFLSKL